MDREKQIFENTVKRQEKAAEEFIRAADKIGVKVTYEQLYELVSAYKDRLMHEMLENRLKMSSPVEITAFWEAVSRLKENVSRVTLPVSSELPHKKPKRKRRSAAEMAMIREEMKAKIDPLV